MENTECVHEFLKLDNTISLFVKKIKNLKKETEQFKHISIHIGCKFPVYENAHKCLLCDFKDTSI